MPYTPTETEIKRHVGDRIAKRVHRLQVDAATVEGERILGRVGGFDAQVDLTERPFTSRCTCFYSSACDHVGAVLHRWRVAPESFAVRAPSDLEIPEQPGALRDFLELHAPHLLARKVFEVRRTDSFMPRGHPLWSLGFLELQEALSNLQGRVDAGDVTGAQAVEPLIPGLEGALRDLFRVRERVERAQQWRLHPPDEDALLPLYEACRALCSEDALKRQPAGGGGTLRLLPDDWVEARLNALPHYPLRLQIRADLLTLAPPYLVADVALVVLDSAVGHAQPKVREAFLAVLAVPPWQRALRHLDGTLALEGPLSAQDRGWRIATVGPKVVEVIPVSLTPFKTKDGFRTKKLGAGAMTDLETAADRATWAALRAKEDHALVVEQLLDHGKVVDDDGMPLRVRRGVLEVAVKVDEGFRLELLLDGKRFEFPEVLVGGARQRVVRRGPAVFVVDVGPVLAGVIDMVVRYGDTFPSEARQALLERLGMLESVVPLRLDAPIRGKGIEHDDRPLILLDPQPDGALRLRVCVEPLPGGSRMPPGRGAVELARTVDGVRQFVQRDLAAEVHHVQGVLANLPLPELIDWEGVLEEPEAGLELTWSLRQREDVRVLWPKRRVTIQEAGASAMRARASRRRDWFGVEGELQAGKSTVQLQQILATIRAGQRFVQLDDGSWVRLADGLRKALRDASQIGTDEPTVRLPPLAAARAMLALEEAGGQVQGTEELTDLADRIRSADLIAVRDTLGLNATLRPYQIEGVTWLRRLSSWSPGGILADEMGLGKTLQALALILERGGRTLVVCPASVNVNWQRECARFAPGLKVGLYRGPDREGLLQGDLDVLITSYEILLRDENVLCEVRFETVVFDEAQALKNARAKRTRSARALDIGFALALSGTPIENDLLELWSLMRVVVPGVLGPQEHFHTRFGNKQNDGPSMGGANLGTLIRPFLLRRTKRVVAPELPEREDIIEWVELSSQERVAYERLRLAAVQALTAPEASPERMAVLAALTRLRQAACATRLIDSEAPAESTKILRMVERVTAVVANEGAVLVFSQFTSVLDLAQGALERRGIRWVRLDGSTSMSKRQEAVDCFQAGGAEVFLISLKAGGTGLNLTAANTVIHLDPWWNPAAEDQASDRAHRIGQTEKVQVIRLVSAGTVEEQVLELHTHKRGLADMLFEGTAGTLSLRSQDLLDLLDVRDED